MPIDFLNVLGFSAITISATTTTIWGNTRLRVGLVLDSIGSIASSSKMDTLKTTSHNLPDRLKSAAIDPEDVYASVIRFNKDVNIGASKYCETIVFNQTGTASVSCVLRSKAFDADKNKSPANRAGLRRL